MTTKEDDERAKIGFTIERLAESLRYCTRTADKEYLIYELNLVLGDLVALIRLLERKHF